MMEMIVKWIFIWLELYGCLIVCCYGLVEQKFAIEPQDQTAIIGSRVTLPCRVVNKSGSLQWTKDDFALGSHRNLSEYDRYRMIGSDEEGDFSLMIESVTLEDNAKFQCQVGAGIHGEPAIRSKFANLNILVPPERPQIVQGHQLTTIEDREIELECVSASGKPAAEITWIDGLGNVVSDNAEYITQPASDSRLTTARSILRFVPKKEHHNTTFVCQAQNAADRNYFSARLLLRVKYAPKVKLEVISDTIGSSLMEGMNVRITCHADANPPEVTYRWFLNDQLVFPDAATPTEYIINNISRNQNDIIIKCEAHNTVGKSEDSETLLVAYGPKFIQKPQSIYADQGTTITFNCNVDSHPNADINWVFATTKKVVGKGTNLTLTVSRETAGIYFCNAFTPNFPEIMAEATLHMKGAPVIKRQPIQYGLLGDNVRLECIAYSVPTAEKVTWSFNNKDVPKDSPQEFTIQEDRLMDGIRSWLIIRESRQENFGAYNCTVSNKYGLDSINILLKPQKGFPIMLALVGVLGLVVLIVTIIMMLILCRRKVKKQQPPPPPAIVIDSEKHCRDSDRSSNASDIKLEIRTGSSASNGHGDLDYGHDTDSIITRIAAPMTSLDSRYSINRYSSSDYPDPVFPLKSNGHNNNGYVPYVDYTRDYNPPPSSLNHLVSSVNTSTGNSMKELDPVLDLRYSAAYGNPYLKSSNGPNALPPLPNGQPPPPPYCTLRNGSIPQLSRYTKSPNSQYIVANNSQQSAQKTNSLATHV